MVVVKRHDDVYYEILNISNTIYQLEDYLSFYFQLAAEINPVHSEFKLVQKSDKLAGDEIENAENSPHVLLNQACRTYPHIFGVEFFARQIEKGKC